jgi:hypothetical protein
MWTTFERKLNFVNKTSSKNKGSNGCNQNFEFEPTPTIPYMYVNTICRKASSIIQSMAIVLASCPQVCICQVILEQVFGHEVIISSLPEYYPHPHEAKTQRDFILSYWPKLERVKNPHSKDKLARKDTLLEVVVSVVDVGSL